MGAPDNFFNEFIKEGDIYYMIAEIWYSFIASRVKNYYYNSF